MKNEEGRRKRKERRSIHGVGRGKSDEVTGAGRLCTRLRGGRGGRRVSFKCLLEILTPP